MIDIATILLCTLLALYVCVHAARLDRTVPWFETRAMFDRARARAAAVAGRRAGGAVAVAEPDMPREDAWRDGADARQNPYGAGQRARDPRLGRGSRFSRDPWHG